MTFAEGVKALPEDCQSLLENRDGGWRLCDLLPKLFSTQDVSIGNARPWEVCGLAVYKELVPMRKDQVDLENEVVLIPNSKTPNGVAEVPLTEIAMEAFGDQIKISSVGP